jgi:hypothetical protein
MQAKTITRLGCGNNPRKYRATRRSGPLEMPVYAENKPAHNEPIRKKSVFGKSRLIVKKEKVRQQTLTEFNKSSRSAAAFAEQARWLMC